ncbi:MAG: hypothetical protein QOH57_1484 [Mycobacterium sp.]|nr:hypothetical protein [Mycobacterium sp.]
MSDDQLIIDDIRGVTPHDHAVHFYGDDLALTSEVARFVTSGLELGESIVVAVTGEHRAAIATLLGPDLPAHAEETLVFLDAGETLDAFMVAGAPDRDLLESTIGPIFEAAAQAGRPIRAFGEMVALLWTEGNITGALALESLWNDLAAERQFFLMCAYPAAGFAESPLRDVDALRDLHSQSWLLGLSTTYGQEQVVASAHTSWLVVPVPTMATVSLARQFVIHTLHDWEAPHMIDAAAAITSELATNAVVHARSAYRLTLSRTTGSLRIAVEDSRPGLLDARTGRRPDGVMHGLATVRARASRCGYSLVPEGKTVWAELGMRAGR